MSSARRLLKALRTKDLHEAHEIFASAMQAKVKKRLAEEKADVMKEEDDDNPADGEDKESDGLAEGTKGPLTRMHDAQKFKIRKGHRLGEDAHKCDQCGSTKDVREVGDGYVCKECDVED